MSSVNKPDPSTEYRASMPPLIIPQTQEQVSAEKADHIEQEQFGGVPIPHHETSVSSDSIPHTTNPQPELSVSQYLSSVVSSIKERFRNLYNSLFKKTVTNTPPVTPSVGLLIEGKLKQLQLVETQLKTLKINLANPNSKQLPMPGEEPKILTIHALTANIATLRQEIDGLSQRLPHVILQNVHDEAEGYQENLHRALNALSTNSGTLDPINPVGDLIEKKITALKEQKKELLSQVQKNSNPILKGKLMDLENEIISYRSLQRALPNSLNSTQREQAHKLVQAEYELALNSLSIIDSEPTPFQSSNSLDLMIKQNLAHKKIEPLIDEKTQQLKLAKEKLPNLQSPLPPTPSQKQLIDNVASLEQEIKELKHERDLLHTMNALLTETDTLDPINPIADLVTKKLSELTDQRKVLYNRLNFFEKFLGRHLDIWRDDITKVDNENISYQYLQEALPKSLTSVQRKQAYELAKTEYETILLNSTSHGVQHKPLPILKEIEKPRTYETPVEEFPRQYASILQGIEEELHFEQVLSEIKDEQKHIEETINELALTIDAAAPSQKERLEENLAKLQENLDEVHIKEIVHKLDAPDLSSTETLRLIEELCDVNMSLMDNGSMIQNESSEPQSPQQEGSSIADIKEILTQIDSLENQLQEQGLSPTERELLKIDLEYYEQKLTNIQEKQEDSSIESEWEKESLNTPVDPESFDNNLADLPPQPEDPLLILKKHQSEFENIFNASKDLLKLDGKNVIFQKSMLLLLGERNKIENLIASPSELKEQLTITDVQALMRRAIDELDHESSMKVLVILEMRTKIMTEINTLIEEKKNQMDLES